MNNKMKEMKNIYEMMIFEDTKYEPNVTNDETNNISDCSEFDDGSMIFKQMQPMPQMMPQMMHSNSMMNFLKPPKKYMNKEEEYDC